MRRPLSFLVLLAAFAAVPAGAQASYDYRTLDAAEAQAGDCLRPRATGPGVARTSWTAPAEGYFDARLSGGRRGDWDLAVFQAGRGNEPVAVSTSFGSEEQATLWVKRGQRFTVQACRLQGGPERIGLTLDLNEMQIPDAGQEQAELQRVTIGSDADIDRLYGLGLDVTDAIGPDSAIVATYSESERRKLDATGMPVTTIEDDLDAKDERSRSIERRAARDGETSGLPSGDTAYRTYADFTNDMKALVEEHPDLVRPVVIGKTYEGRTIQGVEIASDVNGDDGRAVYLNMGAHHAREWPSAEFPMEFAIELAQKYGSDPRVTKLLDDVRVVVIPVVNVDGFIASRSFGTSPLDDDQNATLTDSLLNRGAYIRKNCRPTLPGAAALPCAARTGSGVDINRNYGAYWGGAGASTDPSSQGYRGTWPFSEPESRAMQKYMSSIAPLINITNHTFTEEGEWLRQPGFEDAPITDPDGDGVHDVPDGPVHKEIGDAMAAATGWQSNKSTILGSITGATEDWNYYVQSAYGFTPEGRGPNFHGTFDNAVATEFTGDATHSGQGVYEAFLRAGEIASKPANHSIIEGSAPAGAKLQLIRNYETPVNTGDPVHDHLEVTTTVPESGEYEWHVGPSSRPLHTGEAYKMTCTQPGGETFEHHVVVDRGESVKVNWAANDACGKDDTEPPPPPPPGSKLECDGQKVTIRGTAGDDRIRGTKGNDVIAARDGDDRVVGRGGDDTICSGSGDDVVRGSGGDDTLLGGEDDDKLRGGTGADGLYGGPGIDRLGGGPDMDRCFAGKSNRDVLKGCEARG